MPRTARLKLLCALAALATGAGAQQGRSFARRSRATQVSTSFSADRAESGRGSGRPAPRPRAYCTGSADGWLKTNWSFTTDATTKGMFAPAGILVGTSKVTS